LPISYGGFRYFITFIDDFSCWIAIYFLKNKIQCPPIFTEFRTAAEKMLGYPIVFLHIDNTPKLVEGQFCDYCTMHGITYEKTVPDASQQNGIAE
jgi:hypothetical protein